MSLIYSGYFKGKSSTKERRTSKSSGVILYTIRISQELLEVRLSMVEDLHLI